MSPKPIAHGPAVALMVASSLLAIEGLITIIGGLFVVCVGMWPLVFNVAPPGDEEVDEAIVTMVLGMMTFGWGAVICFGVSRMVGLSSYQWAMAGAVVGVFPLLVGVFAIVVLINPEVVAGFSAARGDVDGDYQTSG